MCYKETTRSLLFLVSIAHIGVLQVSDCSSDECSTKKDFFIGSNVSVEVDGNTWEGCRFVSQDVARTYSCCYSTLARGDSLCDPERQGEDCRKDVRVEEREASCVIFIFNVQQSDAGYYQVIFPGALSDNTWVEVTVNERNIVTETISLATKETDVSSTSEIEDVKADIAEVGGISLITVSVIIILLLLVVNSVFIVLYFSRWKKKKEEVVAEEKVEMEDMMTDKTEQDGEIFRRNHQGVLTRFVTFSVCLLGILDLFFLVFAILILVPLGSYGTFFLSTLQIIHLITASEMVGTRNYWRDCLRVRHRKTKTESSEGSQEERRKERETLLWRMEDMDRKLERMDGMLSQLMAVQTIISANSSSKEIARERRKNVIVADVEPVLNSLN